MRVLVADDHPAMRGALARAIREHPLMELVGEAANGHSALAGIADLQPHVALIDVRMPAPDGLSVLCQLTDQDSPVRVIMISGFDDPTLVHRAIAAGAAGFLSKEAEEADICQGILDVATGGSVLSSCLHGGVFKEIREQRRPEVSSREQQLLELAAGGSSGAAIASQLSLSPHTVRTYWKRLYEKLGVNDRSSAIAEALRRGILQ